MGKILIEMCMARDACNSCAHWGCLVHAKMNSHQASSTLVSGCCIHGTICVGNQNKTRACQPFWGFPRVSIPVFPLNFRGFMRFLSDFRLVICLQISLPVNSASAYTLNADFRFKKSKFSVFRLVKTGNPSSLENPLLVVPKCFFSKCSFSTEYFLTSGGRKIPHLNICVSFPPITEDRALVVWMNDKLVYVICKSWALVYQDKGTQKQTHTHTLTHT